MGRIQLVEVIGLFGLALTLDVELHNAKVKFAREFPEDAERIARGDRLDADREVST